MAADKGLKVIIAGTRTFAATEDQIDKWIKEPLEKMGGYVAEVVSGGATGIDAAGEKWARAHDIPIKVFKADWDKHGRAAGPIRNRLMAEYADALVVIWDGKSPGSKNMLTTACALKLMVHSIHLDPP